MSYKVYVLVDPRNGEIRYVGWTGYSLRNRLSAHFTHYYSRGRLSPKSLWIIELEREDLRPQIYLLEDLGDDSLNIDRAEERWVRRLGLAGCRLLNNTLREKRLISGGMQPRQEWRRKLVYVEANNGTDTGHR